MIQRIQTLFLLIAVGILVSSFFMDISRQGEPPLTLVKLSLFSLDYTTPEGGAISKHQFTGYFFAAATAMALFIIFDYKNRSRQMWLCTVNMVIILAAFILILWGFNQALEVAIAGSAQFGVTFFAPALSLAMHLLAYRAIKKDDDMVKDADRMR